MRTARSSSRPGSRPPWEQAPPGAGTPQEQTPWSRPPPGAGTSPLGAGTPRGPGTPPCEQNDKQV